MSLTGLAIITTIGCTWLSRSDMGGPSCCRVQPSSDLDVFWTWFAANGDPNDASRSLRLLAPGISVNGQKIDSALRTYRDRHDRATSADYFSSLGMSCQTQAAERVCQHAIRVKYTCTADRPVPGEPDRQYQGFIDIRLTISAKDFVAAKATLRGENGQPCPPTRVTGRW